MKQKVSIIIPCKEIDTNTLKCISKCLEQDYKNFEIIVLPDCKKNYHAKSNKVRIIETGAVMPAAKRNIAMKKADGDFFAFIDSDAYPEKNWLKNALSYFKDSSVGLVGGPNLTPKETNFAEKISGYALGNFFVTGPACIRYKIAKKEFVKELPSCNYISRKEVSPEYDESFLTAEDSKFCFDIEKKGKKVLYGGDVVVYHHRRDNAAGHLKQMFIYGRDIAWLAKEEFTFEKLYYSILSLFVLGVLIGIASLITNLYPINLAFIYFLAFYSIMMLLTSIHENLITTLAVTALSIATHFAYGIGFIYGLVIKKPKRQLKA